MRGEASSRDAISQVTAAASNSSAKLLLPTNVSPEALILHRGEADCPLGLLLHTELRGLQNWHQVRARLQEYGLAFPEKGR